MKNRCFDAGHGQAETVSGLLVREYLKFAEYNDSSQVLPEI
jgi:hypothetical protein